jgi:hypothetical protein
MNFILGKNDTKNVNVDIQLMLRSRVLVQANSGGGKSWLLRRMIEQCFGEVQQIVLDVEGEFISLREKYDILHVGKGGDINTDARSAALLAERLLELNASAVIDLYELKHYDRIQYVKLFLDAMVNIRKELWHPCIVYIDEAHIFAPEHGESAALQSVIDIVTRGRKRSFCSVLATQRLSKLHKDTAAELKNVLIGGTTIDIDLKRANDSLGFATKEKMYELRKLDPGEFFAFGPAISKEVISVKIGEVQTTHPDATVKQKGATNFATPDKIKKMLDQLKDLPKEAEEKQRSIDSLKKEISDLKRELAAKPKGEIIQPDIEGIKKQIRDEYERRLSKLQLQIASFELETKARMKTIIEQATKSTEIKLPLLTSALTEPVQLSKPIQNVTKYNPIKERLIIPENEQVRISNFDEKLGRCERLIVGFLLSNGSKDWSKEQIAIMIGYSSTSSGFGNALSKLNTLGLIKRNSGKITLGTAAIPPGIDTDMDFSIDNIQRKLGRCENESLKVLIENKDRELDKEEVAGATLQPSGNPYSAGSSGFGNSLSKLSTLGILTRVNGKIKLSDEARELL